MNSNRIVTMLAACTLAAMAPSAFALSTWNFSTSGGCAQSGSGFGNSWSCNATGPGPTATATAWSTTGSGASFAAANAAQYGTSGFGVRNTVETLSAASPDHSMDNSGQTDLLSLKFASSVKLDSLKLGWYSNDSDVSVLAYTSASPPPSSIAGKTVANLLSSGWSLVANLSNVGSSSPTFNAGGIIGSSWWLISAYNSGYNGSAALDGSSDYVKLLSVSNSTPGKVPEPGSLALVGLATCAALSLRRRKTQTA